MTRQEASKIIEQYRMCSSGDCPTLECADCEYNHDPRKVEEAFLMAIDALESAQPEPCEDCVSRRAVLRLLHSGYHRRSMIDEAKELPSAQPEQKWIPCSERLPEDTVIVTVETKTFKYKYVCEAVWIPRWSKKAEYDNWEDCSEYNEDEDEYYVLEGWYERVHNWDEYSFVGIEDDVIAWMPLPEPYGGETGIGRAND